MKISFNWLKEYVECGLGPSELAERLTMSGLEVESIAEVVPSVDGIVVGRIASVEKHPSADRLSVCRVNDGAKELTVVCGAKNFKAGDAAPLARPGVTLPNGTLMREARLRGVLSEGMLCSERELELGENAGGIMILPEPSVPGMELAEALKLRDSIFDINVTPNRPDCLSVIGIAREVAALTGAELRIPSVVLKEEGEEAGGVLQLRVEDGELCPRYTARLIRDVTVRISPFWMRNRLGMAGLRPVNNIVDATNYVLTEYGQPLHSFDFGKIRGGLIVVRSAREGEKIVAIDGKTRALSEGMLVIADADAPVAIAGVMGGRESEVSGDTTAVLLESAYFQPRSVRRTSRALNLSSDSSYRFERGTDFDGVLPASARAAALIVELGGGSFAGARSNASPPKSARPG